MYSIGSTPAPDYFHPSEHEEAGTNENSVIEMADQKDNEIKRGYSGLQDGEVITQFGGKKKTASEGKYCTKRCACIVWW